MNTISDGNDTIANLACSHMSLPRHRYLGRTAGVMLAWAAAFLLSVPPGHAANPIGFHDGSTCAQTHGWACDADNYGMPLEIEFYKDAPFGSGGVLVGRTTADGPRGPGVAQNCGGHSDRGYVYPTPLTLKDGQSHKIYAYARNIRSDGSPTGSLQILNTSPKTLQCALQVPELSRGYVLPKNKQGINDHCVNAPYRDARYARFAEMQNGIKIYNLWWSQFEHWEVASSYNPVSCPSGTQMLPANATEKANKGYNKYRCMDNAVIQKFDDLLGRDAAQGIQSAAVIWSSAPSYRYEGCTGFPWNDSILKEGCVPRDDAMEDYEDYVRFLADHYNGGNHGKLYHFIVWNEAASGGWFDYSPVVPTDGEPISLQQIEIWIDKYADMLKRTHKVLEETTSGVLMHVSIDHVWTATIASTETSHIGSKRLMDGLWDRLGPGPAWSVAIHPYGNPTQTVEGRYTFDNLDLVSDYQRGKLASYGISNPDDYPQTYLYASEQGWLGSNGQATRAKFVCVAHARAMEEKDMIGVTHNFFHNCIGQDQETTHGLLPMSVNYDLSNMESDPVGLAYLATGLDQWGKRSDHYCCANHNLGCGTGGGAAEAIVAGNTGKVVTQDWRTIDWGGSLSSPVVIAGVGSQYGGDTAGLRIKDVTGGGFTAFVEEETSANSEINHIPEEVHYLAMNSGAIREDGGSVIGEAGILAGNQANGNTWHTVNLTQTYSSPPVVLMSMVTFNGGQPAHIRLRNVTAGSFEYQIEEWDYLDQGHTTETMHYIALTPGTHTVDGKKVRAGTAGSVNQSWKTVNYGTTFSAAPAVISQAQTYNDAAAIVTRQKNAGSSRFEVRVQEEEGNNASHGSETVGFVAVDAAGGDGNGDPGQVPFGGSAHAIPGRIEAEDFDLGGEGVAYHDTESNNKGGDYRPQEGADIQNTGDSGGGYNVGWIRKGEWLEYTVNVAESRTYTLKARVATPYAGKTFRMEVDGQNVSGSISVPNTGGWQNFQTISQGGISLGAGSHVIRLHFESGSMNLNFVELL